MVRQKTRYILCRIHSSANNLLPSDIANSIKDSVTLLHGRYGCACVSSCFNVKYINVNTKLIILKVSHAFHLMLRSSLPFVKKVCIQGSRKAVDCVLETLSSGGTVRGLQKSIIKHDRKKLYSFKAKQSTSEKKLLKAS